MENISGAIADTFLDAVGMEFEHVNWGGCGVFAYYAHIFLARIGVNTRIRVVADIDDVDAMPSVEQACRDAMQSPYYYPDEAIAYNENGLHFDHVVLELDDGTLFDCNGVHSLRDDMTLYDGALPAPLLRALISNWTNWNCFFDRTQIPAMVRAILNACVSINSMVQSRANEIDACENAHHHPSNIRFLSVKRHTLTDSGTSMTRAA